MADTAKVFEYADVCREAFNLFLKTEGFEPISAPVMPAMRGTFETRVDIIINKEFPEDHQNLEKFYKALDKVGLVEGDTSIGHAVMKKGLAPSKFGDNIELLIRGGDKDFVTVMSSKTSDEFTKLLTDHYKKAEIDAAGLKKEWQTLETKFNGMGSFAEKIKGEESSGKRTGFGGKGQNNN